MSNSIPEVNLNLNCLSDFYDKDMARNVLDIINSYGKEYIPDRFDSLQPLNKKYNPDNIDQVISTWRNDEGNKVNIQEKYLMGSLLMQKKRSSQASYYISWEKSEEASFNNFSLGVDINFLKKEKNFNKYLELCKEIIIALNPVQGQISNMMDKYSCEPINLKIRHPELQWVTIFGQPYIELFGKEKLMKTPCYKVYEITDQLIAIQLTETIFEEIPEELRENVRGYLGGEAFVKGNKFVHSYKNGIVPQFDFSNVLFDSSMQIGVPQIIKRRK